MTNEPNLRSAYVLLDRDGTIIIEKNYLSDPESVELIPGAAAAISCLNAAGLGIAIVTNQSGIGRGYFDEPTLLRIHERMRELLAVEDAFVDQIYYCPHTPMDHCECRKPATGMIERAATELKFTPADSFVVGDSHVDMELALTAGATPVLVMTGHGKRTAEMAIPGVDLIANDLLKASALILKKLRSRI